MISRELCGQVKTPREADETRQVTSTQKLASDAQIEKTEKDLAKMRAELMESAQVMEQKEMSKKIECVFCMRFEELC